LEPLAIPRLRRSPLCLILSASRANSPRVYLHVSMCVHVRLHLRLRLGFGIHCMRLCGSPSFMSHDSRRTRLLHRPFAAEHQHSRRN